jgi:hypothetical protein
VLLTVTSANGLSEAKKVSVTIPVLRPGAGFGESVIPGSLKLPFGIENTIVTNALLLTFRGMQLALVTPPMSISNPLPPDKPVKFDVAEISPAMLAEYNAQCPPDLKLPTTQIFGISFDFRYVVQPISLSYTLQPHLFTRGARSSFRKFDGDFSGEFFVAAFEKSFQANLRAAAAGADR